MVPVISNVVGVFSEIGTWIASTITDFSQLFYADGSLTFIGTMAIASLGIGVVLLLFNKVKDFVQFRG